MKKIIGPILVLLAFSGSVIHAQGSQTPSRVPPTIISFACDLDSATLDDAESGNAALTFAWQTVGIMYDLQVQLHVYQVNKWFNVLEEGVDPLSPTGTHQIQIQHSQTFSPPMYRLVIVSVEKKENEQGILDERVIVIPYAVPNLSLTPTIDSFTTSASSVDANELASGLVQIPVSWQVGHRSPGVNLVFEQVFDDLTTTNIELPRPNLWVSSSGSGMVAPQMPPGGNRVKLRLRLVDLEADKTLQEMSLSLPITGTVVPTETPRPAPPTVPTAPATPTPQIVSFTASPNPYSPGQPLTLAWDVRGATSVRIVQRHWDGYETTFATNQTPSGSWTFSLPVPDSYRYPYVLAYLVIPTNSAGQEVVDWSKAIQVPVACPFDFFFGAMAGKCPELPNPERASAAFRTFERSFMVCGQVIPYLCSFPMARGNFTPIFGPREHLSPLLTRHRPPD